jgi:hypothetical protein
MNSRLCRNIALFCFIISSLSCEESQVVEYEPQKQSPGMVDESTLLPQIQHFYPGTLQTLDVPVAYPTSLPPDAVQMVLIFSSVMENSSGQMSDWISLFRNDAAQDFTLIPDESSNIFIIIPDAAITATARYSVFISSSAHIENESDKTLNLTPLVQPPATTIDPPDSSSMEYCFQTGAEGSIDYSPPSILQTDPVDNENNVEVNLTASGGAIVIVFYDNANPMIDPLTVNTSSVTMSRPGFGAIAGTLSIDTTDYNFKRYMFTPSTMPLESGATYLLNISVDNAITDFSGNSVPETTIAFTTEL